MTPALWVSLVGLALTLAGWAITYGGFQQKVTNLEVRVAKNEAALEAKDAARTADREAVIRLEEQMKHLQATLDRMDDKLTEALREKKPATRRAAS